ncbi:MAG: hypothetical protein D6687_00025 [Acidobacteria bacterium]|nr:MAG: hypothetical protein D6687_00025 [Acidobacteriota bacterium]
MNLYDIAVLALLSTAFSFNFAESKKEFFISLLTAFSINIALLYAQFSMSTIVYGNVLAILSAFLLPHDRLIRLYKMRKITDIIQKRNIINNDTK